MKCDRCKKEVAIIGLGTDVVEFGYNELCHECIRELYNQKKEVKA